MRIFCFFCFFIYLSFEFAIFNAVANTIGVLLTLIAIFATSILGLSLVKSEGIKNFIQMKNKLVNRENPTNEVIRNISLFIAGFLLLIPGFFTDILGAILLLSPIQRFLFSKIIPKMNIKTYGYEFKARNDAELDIIEGEFKRKND